MPKYPETQARITRLMIEAGFRYDGGTYDRKRFCEETGLSPRQFKSYFDGKTHLSSNRLIELARKAGLISFNIL